MKYTKQYKTKSLMVCTILTHTARPATISSWLGKDFQPYGKYFMLFTISGQSVSSIRKAHHTQLLTNWTKHNGQTFMH